MAYLRQKNSTKEQINKFKMTEREIHEKFGNLNDDELNRKNKKQFTSEMMT